MAIDGTMFFGGQNLPLRAIQFGTFNNIIVIQDYFFDYELGCNRFQTWIAKPTAQSIPIIKEVKSLYRDFQRAESRSLPKGKKHHTQYVSSIQPKIRYQDVFEMVPRNSSQAEKYFISAQSNNFHFNDLKAMFKAQFRAIDGYSFAAVMSGLHLMTSIRGFNPINWTVKRFNRNPLYSKRMINRMASHVK
jgi:hypothetical protein